MFSSALKSQPDLRPAKIYNRPKITRSAGPAESYRIFRSQLQLTNLRRVDAERRPIFYVFNSDVQGRRFTLSS